MKQSFYIAALETRSSSDKKLELSVCIFFRQLFRIEPENRYFPYGNNDVWLHGLYL